MAAQAIQFKGSGYARKETPPSESKVAETAKSEKPKKESKEAAPAPQSTESKPKKKGRASQFE